MVFMGAWLKKKSFKLSTPGCIVAIEVETASVTYWNFGKVDGNALNIT